MPRLTIRAILEVERQVSSVTVSYVPISAPTNHGDPHSRLARWAVRLSVVFGATAVTSIGAVAITHAVGAESAVEDTWLGWFLGYVALAGFLGSLGTFLGAMVAKIRRERWTLLWLPLCLFPVLLTFLVLGEAFWWE